MKSIVPSTLLLSSSEIELHYKRPLMDSMYLISNPEDADTILRTYIRPEEIDLCEHFWVILMTTSNRVLSISKVASGTTVGVQTNLKYIFQLILKTNAAHVVLVHNHPGGNLKVSASDIKETKKFLRLAKLMDVTLLDHIIITSESFSSFATEGLL